MICAAVALGTLKSIDGIDDDVETGVQAVDDLIEERNDLRDNTYAATGSNSSQFSFTQQMSLFILAELVKAVTYTVNGSIKIAYMLYM